MGERKEKATGGRDERIDGRKKADPMYVCMMYRYRIHLA